MKISKSTTIPGGWEMMFPPTDEALDLEIKAAVAKRLRDAYQFDDWRRSGMSDEEFALMVHEQLRTEAATALLTQVVTDELRQRAAAGEIEITEDKNGQIKSYRSTRWDS